MWNIFEYNQQVGFWPKIFSFFFSLFISIQFSVYFFSSSDGSRASSPNSVDIFICMSRLWVFSFFSSLCVNMYIFTMFYAVYRPYPYWSNKLHLKNAQRYFHFFSSLFFFLKSFFEYLLFFSSFECLSNIILWAVVLVLRLSLAFFFFFQNRLRTARFFALHLICSVCMGRQMYMLDGSCVCLFLYNVPAAWGHF